MDPNTLWTAYQQLTTLATVVDATTYSALNAAIVSAANTAKANLISALNS